MRISRLLICMPFAAAVGYWTAPTDAVAAYSGTITRSVCAIAAVPRKIDRDYLDISSACHLVVNDTSGSTYRYAGVSVPVERKTSTVTISSKVNFTTDGSNGFTPAACVQSLVWSSTGTLSAAGGLDDCTDPFNYPTFISPDSLTLPVDGSISLSLAAIDSIVWRNIQHTWAANGT